MSDLRRGVFLDRDGTLIESHEYLSDPDLVALLPGVAAGLRALRGMGLSLVMVTNQSAIGRGFFDEQRLEQIHQRLRELLAEVGVVLDGLYFCPHTPGDGCACRKPGTALFERAAEELSIDLKQSFVVGDNVCDVEAALGTGARSLLVRTGYGLGVERRGETTPDHTVDDLSQAADVIRDILGLSVAT